MTTATKPRGAPRKPAEAQQLPVPLRLSRPAAEHWQRLPPAAKRHVRAELERVILSMLAE